MKNILRISGVILIILLIHSCKKDKPTPPIVTTTTVTAITQTAGTSGGNITNDGGVTVLLRGVCWSTNNTPTITDNKTLDGAGAGSFVSAITGLTANTTYFVRAYATNSSGTGYGMAMSFTTQLATLPILTTANVTTITQNSAICGGTITSDGAASITSRGVCWSTSQNPTTSDIKTSDGTGTGIYASTMAGLIGNTTYFVRAYATNSAGTEYGNQVSFKTSPLMPTISTATTSSITQTTATSGGNISSGGGATVTTRGVCWSTSAIPTIANSKTINGTGTGVFTSSISGLTAGTTYYVRAYATNSIGTAYGNEISFTTTSATVPTLTTIAASSITATTATSGGAISNDGGVPVTARGVCWSTSQNPTTSNSKTDNGSGIGTFISSITGLTLSTTYYVRSYATNLLGTSYGGELTFTSLNGVAVLTTTSTAIISTTSAVSGGNITSDGGYTITARGVCLSTTHNPTIADSKTIDGSGTGSFVSYITGLQSNTTYYMRAYAVNAFGTQYGTELTFKTLETITDIDGNVYNTVTIGTQTWMAENLKTTKYNDGTTIFMGGGNLDWSLTGSPASCWYNNDEVSFKATYGALHNWYAVNTGKLCPQDWHVPTDAEWSTLTTYLGGEIVAGGKLKESGFTALPGGLRGNRGIFSSLGAVGYWWSSTQYNTSNSWSRNITSSYSDVNRNYINKNFGFSVRCLKD